MLFAMSIITVQLGQCGNQIGGQLFQTFMEDVHSKPLATQVSARQLTEVFGCRSSSEAFSAEQVLASAYQNFVVDIGNFAESSRAPALLNTPLNLVIGQYICEYSSQMFAPIIKFTYCVTLYTLGWSKKSESDFFWLF